MKLDRTPCGVAAIVSPRSSFVNVISDKGLPVLEGNTSSLLGRISRQRLLSAVFLIALLGLCQALSVAQVLSPVYFPPPTSAFRVLGERLRDGSIWPSLGSTVMRMFYGWVLACLLGVAVGGLIGSSTVMRDYLRPILEFFRSLPASAIMPMAVLFLGLSNQMSIVVIAFGSIWPVLLGSVQGFSTVKSRLIEVFDMLQLTWREGLVSLTIPSALPDIMTGARISLAIALILAVVTEMQASLPGLGSDIFQAQRAFRSPELYAGLLVLGMLGFGLSYTLQLIERRLLRWHNPHN